MTPAFDTENTKAQMRKGTLEFCILLIINHSPGIYAPEILKKLSEIDMIVVEGTIYPLLSRLKRDGMLEYEWEESKSGPPRKLYSLTKDGKAGLKNLIAHWHSLSTSLHSLLSQ